MPEIIKSDCDKRDYKLVKLDNGMRCLLISDMEADKAAAAIDVHVGSGLDPKPLYGVAHFLEHMLFQGNDKYPGENEYSEFIKNNGGYDNAFTSLEDTNYHFECSNEAFEEALDRLAMFFICPNFKEESAEREVKAVDSEYNQSLQHDGWHFYNLCQQVSNKEGNYCRFACGNCKSLEQPGIRDSLLDFHKKWYSSNIMTLTIIGKYSIDWLEKQVREKFSPVENKNVTVPDLGSPAPYEGQNLGKLIKYVPVQDEDVLSFFYVLDYTGKDHKCNPLRYFSEMIGHEGENSLLSYLKSENLALELCTDLDHNLDCMSTFGIDITLTKEGLENYEKVIEATFQYLQKIKEAGPCERFFQETKDVGQMTFLFADKGSPMNTCVSFARQMHQFDESNIDQLIRSKYIVDEFDQEKIKKYANDLCQTDKFNILIRSKTFEGKTDKVAEWYNTKFSHEDFSDDLKKKMTEPKCEIKGCKLDIPPPNTLIPKNFDILENQEDDGDAPQMIKNWPGQCQLWYKKDKKFMRPKGMVQIKIYTRDCLFGEKPEARVFANVWNDVLSEYLREFNYMANLAKLGLNVTLLSDNINLDLAGYNDSMPNYVEQILQKFKEMPSQDLRLIFDQVKEKLLQDWKNFYLKQSYQQAFAMFDTVITNLTMEIKQLRQHLETFTYEQFQEYLKDWLKNGLYVWYVTGNFSREDSIKMCENFMGQLALNPVKVSDLPEVRTIALDAKKSFTLQLPLADASNENSCSLVHYEVDCVGDNKKLKMINSVVMQYFDEPFFDQLRTKQQLGYVVFSRGINNIDVLGNQFLVQSAKRSCEYLIHCINNFLIEQREEVKKLTDDQFEVYKQSIHTKLSEKDINLPKEYNRFGAEISTHKYNFKRQAEELEILATVTKDEFLAHIEKVFFSDSTKRIELQLMAECHKEEQVEYAEKNKDHEIFKSLERVLVTESLMEFKKRSGMHPDVYKANFAKYLESQ